MEAEFQAELDEAPYLGKLHSLCGWRLSRLPHGASQLLSFLYLGSQQDAADLALLHTLGITHVLNCAAGYTKTNQKYYGKIKYKEFQAEDEDDYDMMQHFKEAYHFIEDARQSGGKIMIHCLMGINRSGVLAIAYIMVHKNIGPISAVQLARRSRSVLLTNDGFQRQIVRFAHQRGLLFLDQKLLWFWHYFHFS